MKYELTEQISNNLLVFLNRVEIKGLQELNAMNEILNVLQKPIQEEKKSSPEQSAS